MGGHGLAFATSGPEIYPEAKSLDPEAMERIRADFYRAEEVERLQAHNMQIKFILVGTYEDPRTQR